MPPLRERKGDIPLLVHSFVKEFARENSKNVKSVAPDALDALLAFSWPGNVRELRTALEHAVVLCRTDVIGWRDLPASVRASGTAALMENAPMGPGELTVKEAEKQLMIRALKETNGNRTAAAQKLGLSRRTMHRRLHTYHLEHL